jgi:hypothetical protein
MKLIDVDSKATLEDFLTLKKRLNILDKNVQVVVRNDLDVNEHERLSNITLRHY